MRTSILLLLPCLFLLGSSRDLSAQAFQRAGVQFSAVRPVNVPAGKSYAVVVTQFFHHGQIAADGRNVMVCNKDQEPVPTRLLQLGPGDYCRLAFQATSGRGGYEIFYGGDAVPAKTIPPWTNKDGLLLETREYKQCNLNSLESVRDAFLSAKPIGADYVDAVQNAYNPFSLATAPFLSKYTAVLHIDTAGTYGFMTSSQDCSFLLIDGRVIVDAPGMHHPQYQALRGSRKDVQLAAGGHSFEYYHAASGPSAMMVAAWEINPRDPKPVPKAIPPEAFRATAIGRAAAGPVTTRSEKIVPDFLVSIAGSVPLPENDVPLIGVQFANVSPRSLVANSKFFWDFGDGQISEAENPAHVYLHPGLYAVKLTARRGGRPYEMVNRFYVDQPKVTAKDTLHKLEDYLPTLRSYDPRTLDAASLCQWILALQAKADALVAGPEKADALVAGPESEKHMAVEPEEDPATAARKREALEIRKTEATKYIELAAMGAKAALTEESAAKGDEDLVKVARLAGPMARDRLGDSKLAGSIWAGAARKAATAEARGECQMEAADIAVNDLVNPAAGKAFLDGATKSLSGPNLGALAAHLARVTGDYAALTGDGKAARKAYAEADTMYRSRRNNTEQAAWQGAHGRSTEEFIKTGELDRAMCEIRQWQEESPGDKITGYITLMYARYWFARHKYPQVISLAGQLSAVNPDSPYIDQLLILAAQSDLAQNDRDRAIARLESLVKSYPGSPLVPKVKEKIAELKGGGAEPKNEQAKPPAAPKE